MTDPTSPATDPPTEIPFMERTKTRRALLRWYRRHIKGWVELRTYYEYDPDDAEEGDYLPYDCLITRQLIPKDQLPAKAVHCTGEPGVYNLDTVHTRYAPHDGGFSAMDEWHWIQYGGFEESLSPKWTALDHVDMKKVLLIGGVAIAVCIIVWLITGGGE